MGPLTEDHHCPRGVLSRISDALTTVLVGGVVGALACYAIVERPAVALVVAAAALGAVLANAVRQAVGGRL